MGHEARKAAKVPGIATVDISLGLIAAVLTTGWTTGHFGLRCAKGLPPGATIRNVEWRGQGLVRLTIQHPDLPAMSATGIPHAIKPEIHQDDVRQETVSTCIRVLSVEAQEIYARRRTHWLARVLGMNRLLEAQARALVAVMPRVRDRDEVFQPPLERPAPAKKPDVRIHYDGSELAAQARGAAKRLSDLEQEVRERKGAADAPQS